MRVACNSYWFGRRVLKMKLLFVILLAAFIGTTIAIRRKRDNSYGDEPVTPAPASGDVHEGVTDNVEGSGAAVEGSGSGAKEGAPSGGGDTKNAGYASESSGEAPKESAPEAVEQGKPKTAEQQPSGYRK